MSNATVARKIQEKFYSQKARDKMDDSDFGDPENQAFPIKTAQDVINAASRLHNSKGDQAAIKARIIRIAKRKGFPLPQTWQDEKTKESATTTPTPAFKPKERIARLKCYFLEDGAISLNGRKYPREAVDTLVRSAQLRLSDSNALPMTSYLSHDHADNDNILALVGKLSDVQKEGTRPYAMIDVPDTTSGRDLVALAHGKYLRSVSLRASGAEMRMDKESAFPLVGGQNLQLEGIDFTTTPGLNQVARISNVVLESKEPQNLSEVFNFHSTDFQLIEEDMLEEEDNLEPTTSGVTQGVDGAVSADQALPVPAVSSPQAAHDHLASALNLACAPSGMEAGKRFAASTHKHLMAAHDHIANHLNMKCASSQHADDGMQDGDDDDNPSEKATQPAQTTETKEEKPMNKEEALALLKEAGYEVQPPKTEMDLLKEQLAALQQQFAEQKTTQMQTQPQRKSLVEGATVTTEQKRSYARHGDLRERIHATDPYELLDLSKPLPEWMTPERAIKELTVDLLGMFDARYGLE